MGTSEEPRYEVLQTGEVLKHFDVEASKGLDDATVAARLKQYGLNELDKEEKTPLWKLVLEQFDDTLVKILLAAAMVSFALAFTDDNSHEGITAYVEPLVILIILILNAVVGVWQESNAEAALEALKELQPLHARVRRNGELMTIESKFLVPGDIVEVRVGDKVPADMRLLSLNTTTMRIDQSQMTGESTSVMKDADALPASTEDVIQAKTNMLFATTTVTNGIGTAVVVRIGMATEIGKIQASVQQAAEEEEDTPLKKKLDEFGETLSKVIGVVCILVWAINYRNFFDPAHGSVFKGCIYYFKIAVALAVAAIPEGLPAVITTCLALGTRKMAKKNAIVRKLPSVETLGCTTVICSDKTGTLTTNEMCVRDFNVLGSKATELVHYEVPGDSYSPEYSVEGLKHISAKDLGLIDFCKVASLCNESQIEYVHGKYVRVGEPTEAALKVVSEKIGVPDSTGRDINNKAGYASFCSNYWSGKFRKIATLEFSRDRKSMSVICSPVSEKNLRSGTKNVLLVKGAPEGIIQRCTHAKLRDGSVVPFTKEAKEVVTKQVTSYALEALRCLAFAVKEDLGPLADYDGSKSHPAHAKLTQVDKFAEVESDMIFVGLAAMLDPPRPEVRQSIQTAHEAGIRVIVITGDNKLTAESICRKIGVFEDDEDLTGKSFTGGDFFKLSDNEQIRYLTEGGGGRVFSRTEPAHKQALVKMLKQQGHIVAMTGDGVNDAPALKQADIGVAMGITGTEVAKEASDMVLADDNFATIVSAVEEGRAIYNNMQAFIRYLISSNIGEVAAIFLTAALGIPEGLIPVQLLWVNLVTDGPPATALGFNPADPDIMKFPPRRANDALINGWVFFRYMVIGVYVGAACVGVFAYWFMFYTASNDGHTLVTWNQLSHWAECPTWKDFKVNDFGGHVFGDDPCSYFTEGKDKASTLSLSVLVVIEMLNAMNALSEDNSLVTIPPWKNPYLLLAIVISIGVHFLVLYVPIMADIFSLTPLDYKEWLVVLAFSFPVIIIDELLKVVGRYRHSAMVNREKKNV